MRLLLTVLAAALLAGPACTDPEGGSRSSPGAESAGGPDRGTAARLWRRARRLVRSEFAEPAAVRFEDMYFHRAPDGALVVCGWVGTAPNAPLAPAARQRFVSAGTPSRTHLETRTPAFDALWRAQCASRLLKNSLLERDRDVAPRIKHYKCLIRRSRVRT